jgi:hypothetical protein
MSIYRNASRIAIYARLTNGASLGAKVYSNPPTNIAIDHVLIGDIQAERPEDKGEPSGWYSASIETWSQTFSPAALEAVADAVVVRMTATPLALNGRSFTTPEYTGETPASVPAENGGPLYGRVLTFRFYCE